MCIDTREIDKISLGGKTQGRFLRCKKCDSKLNIVVWSTAKGIISVRCRKCKDISLYRL